MKGSERNKNQQKQNMPNTNKTNDMSSGALLCYNKTEDDDIQQTKHVTLRVNSASNLINTDSGIMGDLTDPYVEVFSMLTPYNKFQTSVIMNDLNPVWDEEITLEIMHPEDTVLVFNIWDHNRVAKDKRVGSCALSLTEVKLQRGNAVNVCLNIHDAFSLQGTLQIELVPEDFDFICQQPAIKLDMSTKAGDMQSIIQLKTTKQYTKYLQQQLAHKSYLDVMDEVDTGDLLLSSGVNSVHLAAIQLYTRSMLCYIGMIVKKPSDSLKQAFGLQGNLAVLEVMISSGSEHSQGIRLVDYQAYYKDLAKQGSVCTLRKLTIDDKELTTQIRSSDHLNFAADLAETVPVCSQREYLQHLIETERSDKDVILPGEFIAICMKRLGLLPNSVDTSRFVPQDFAATSNTLMRNGLLKGCSYSPECLLTNTRSLKRLEAFFKSDENKFLF